MNLKRKIHLAARTLGVGKKRILFNTSRLSEIKEAITKQDMRELKNTGAILIREVTGSRKNIKRKTRRKKGSIKKKVKKGKKNYVILTRKLRKYVSEIKKHGKIDKDKYYELRKEIRAGVYKSKSNLKERLGET